MPRATPVSGRRPLTRSQFARAIAGLFDEAVEVDTALETALRLVCEMDDWAVGQAWMARADGSGLEWRAAWLSNPRFEPFCEASRAIVLAPDVDLPGRVWASRQARAVADLTRTTDSYRAQSAQTLGLRSAVAVPLLEDTSVPAVLEFFSEESRTPDLGLVDVIGSIGPPLVALLQRRREQAQRESEDRIRRLFDSPTIGIVFWRRDGRLLDANHAFLDIVGFSREELEAGDISWERLSPAGDRLDESVFRHIETSGVCPPFEKECIRRNGDRVTVLIGGSFAPDSRGVVCYVIDVTVQRHMRDALRASEERYRNLVEHSPDAIFLLDAERVAFVNRAGVRLMGASDEQEIVGTRAFDALHPDYHDLVRQHLRVLTERGQISRPLEQKFTRLDGQQVDVEVFALPFRDGDDMVQLVARDVTERKRAEQERARLLELEQTARVESAALSRKLVEAQELERRSIARELHDEVGQMLTGLSLILKSGPPPPLPWKQRYAEAMQLLHDLTKRVREMSLDLRPAMLDDLGLLAALLWQTERYMYQTKVRVRLHHSGLERRFPAEVETAAYRLVQEALTNVARHAKAREADVHVRGSSTELWVRVSDQGVGFDPEKMGITGSMGLVGMRERISSLGGELSIDSALGRGTFLTASMPVPGPKSAEAPT